MEYPFAITKQGPTYIVKFDQEYWEKFAAAMGLLSDECLESIRQAEKDFAEGRVYQINSFSDLED